MYNGEIKEFCIKITSKLQALLYIFVKNRTGIYVKKLWEFNSIEVK